MGLLKKAVSAAILLVAVGTAVALFYSEDAAQPGNLIKAHARLNSCTICHEAFQGVTDAKCRQCHYFSNVKKLPPALRFHEERRHCLECHTEHQGRKGRIASMDHRLLHQDLTCARCHHDPHFGLFGQRCRQCHGIESWNIASFIHPEREQKQCARCHVAPKSHRAAEFKKHILESHERVYPGEKEIVIRECWRCHVTADWRHLLMEHEL